MSYQNNIIYKKKLTHSIDLFFKIISYLYPLQSQLNVREESSLTLIKCENLTIDYIKLNHDNSCNYECDDNVEFSYLT